MIPTYTLNDGTTMPAIGFGTYPLRGEEGVAAIVDALDAGYRLLDTAVNYENETEVGEAHPPLAASPATSCSCTSKLPGRHHGYDDAVASTRGSLERLGLDYLDLHLIHWPNPSVGQVRRGLAGARRPPREGLVRSIGVSNFTEAHLRRIIDETGVTPAVNQIELHPYFPQAEMRRGARRPRHPHRVLEPAGQAAGAVHRAGGRGGRRPRHGVSPGAR